MNKIDHRINLKHIVAIVPSRIEKNKNVKYVAEKVKRTWYGKKETIKAHLLHRRSGNKKLPLDRFNDVFIENGIAYTRPYVKITLLGNLKDELYFDTNYEMESCLLDIIYECGLASIMAY